MIFQRDGSLKTEKVDFDFTLRLMMELTFYNFKMIQLQQCYDLYAVEDNIKMAFYFIIFIINLVKKNCIIVTILKLECSN